MMTHKITLSADFQFVVETFGHSYQKSNKSLQSKQFDTTLGTSENKQPNDPSSLFFFTVSHNHSEKKQKSFKK